MIPKLCSDDILFWETMYVGGEPQRKAYWGKPGLGYWEKIGTVVKVPKKQLLFRHRVYRGKHHVLSLRPAHRRGTYHGPVFLCGDLGLSGQNPFGLVFQPLHLPGLQRHCLGLLHRAFCQLRDLHPVYCLRALEAFQNKNRIA